MADAYHAEVAVRYFNTEGPVDPAEHYCIDSLARVSVSGAAVRPGMRPRQHWVKCMSSLTRPVLRRSRSQRRVKQDRESVDRYSGTTSHT